MIFPPNCILMKYVDCGSCEKKEKYKFREIFLLRRSHIWHLFLRSRFGIPRNIFWSGRYLHKSGKHFWKFRKYFASHFLHLTYDFFLRPRLGNPQLQRWICLQRWKLPLHRMHVQVWEQNKNNRNMQMFLGEQARKLGRCDSYLQNLKTLPTHPLTDPLTGVGARRCYRI